MHFSFIGKAQFRRATLFLGQLLFTGLVYSFLLQDILDAILARDKMPLSYCLEVSLAGPDHLKNSDAQNNLFLL